MICQAGRRRCGVPGSDGAEIHVLFKRADEADEDAPIHPQEHRSYCAHRQVRLDEDAHRVYCRGCNREVEAYAFLRDLAKKWERYVGARKEAERRAKVAQANLAVLLRDEKNAKARKRRRVARGEQ